MYRRRIKKQMAKIQKRKMAKRAGNLPKTRKRKIQTVNC
jgi:hypothetical protein